MNYVHIISKYEEYLFPSPIMRFFEGKLRVSSKNGEVEYRIPCKTIKKIDVIKDPDKLQEIIAQIVNKQATAS